MKNDLPSTLGDPSGDSPPGRLEARYLAFLETIMHLRPSLHRYCSRMTGSVWDGEDVAQEAVFEAYRKLEKFDDSRPVAPWLFRIAHHRCIDWLRRRGVRQTAEATAAETEVVAPIYPAGPAMNRAVEHLVMSLPPKERACVLLKDVFDHTLEEIADLVDSTVGGVKAALHRGRSKLAEQPISSHAPRARTAEDEALHRLYVERFNQRDWAGMRELISADARLLVVDRFVGRVMDSPYFGTYERMPEPVRVAMGEVDGERVIILLRADGDNWVPRATVRLRVSAGKIAAITDYWFCPWIISAATALRIESV